MSNPRWHRRGSWLDRWLVSEDEPTWPQVIAMGVLFVIALGVLSAAIWLLAPLGAGWPA